jgi:hypothetical protein
MQLFDTIERAHRIHQLIRRKATGNPDEFAEKLHLRRRQLYNILEEFRDYGATIKYNRMRSTFYYGNDFEISVKIGANSLSDKEHDDIYGGNLENNASGKIALHEVFFTLQKKLS